jgi:hypothetical protein
MQVVTVLLEVFLSELEQIEFLLICEVKTKDIGVLEHLPTFDHFIYGFIQEF